MAAMEELDEALEYELFGYPDSTVADCDFLTAVFAACGHGVKYLLDIACGTGRHALEMVRRGYTVTGVDLSPSMLRLAARKAAERGLALELVQQDMAQLSLPPQFDAAYVLFNTLTLLVRNDDLIRFMRGVRAALRPRGLFVLQVGNLWSHIAEGTLGNGFWERDEERGGVRRQLAVQMVIGPHNNVYEQRGRARFWRQGKELAPRHETLRLRAFSLNELDLLARLTGFAILAAYGAADVARPMEDPDRVEECDQPHRSLVLVMGEAAEGQAGQP